MADRPNVLFLLPDQWRRQALGCNGDASVRTPNLDRLAREGANFQRCYAADPVCTPSRASILTGRFPHQTGMISNSLRLPEAEVSLAQCLCDAGYACGYIGKWHLDGEDRPGFVPSGPRRKGFDYFEGFNRGHWYHDPQYFTDTGELVKPDGFESTYQTDLAMAFMEAHRQGPFFLMLSWGPPHMPYVPPEGFDRHTPSDIVWRDNVPAALREEERTVRELVGYCGLCEALDHEMGRLTAFLEEQGLAEETLVVFTSDHGDCHGSHGLHYKGHPEEESLGVPLIVRCPGTVPAGMRPQMPVSLIDPMPTLLSMCGLPIPEGVAGRDLSEALKGGSAPVESVYAEGRVHLLRPMYSGETPDEGRSQARYGAWRAVVTERYKLAVDWSGAVRLLTDLHDDPYELENLADRPEGAQVQLELLDLLQDWKIRTGDPFPEAVPSAGK